MLVGPGRALDPEGEEAFYHHCIYWCCDDKKCKTRQRTRAKIIEKQDETDDELDGCSPRRMEIAHTEIDARSSSVEMSRWLPACHLSSVRGREETMKGLWSISTVMRSPRGRTPQACYDRRDVGYTTMQ